MKRKLKASLSAFHCSPGDLVNAVLWENFWILLRRQKTGVDTFEKWMRIQKDDWNFGP